VVPADQQRTPKKAGRRLAWGDSGATPELAKKWVAFRPDGGQDASISASRVTSEDNNEDSTTLEQKIRAHGRVGKAQTATGELFIWGHTCFCEFMHQPILFHTFNTPLRQVALGAYFGLALTSEGELYAWGDGTYGELGGARQEADEDDHSSPLQTVAVGAAFSACLKPARVPDSNPQTEERTRYVSIAAGDRHSLLLDMSGQLYAFGDNMAGQCGAAGRVDRVSKPTVAKVRAGDKVFHGAQVSAGRRHSSLRTSTHQLFMWGHASSDKLVFTKGWKDGDGSSEALPPGVAVRSGLKDAVAKPRMVFSLLHEKVTQVALGVDCTVVVTGEGRQQDGAPNGVGDADADEVVVEPASDQV